MKWETLRISKTGDLENVVLSTIALLIVLLINKPEDFTTSKNMLLMELQDMRIRPSGLIKKMLQRVKKVTALPIKNIKYENVHY